MSFGYLGHKRVLSIQSHVTFGYVGGKAAVFALQCLGYDVDVVNTVNYSNHAGYGRSGGTRTSAKELAAMLAMLEQNEMMNAGRLVTGYAAGADALSVIAKFLTKIKDERPDLIYLLDPVMGDSGVIYVDPDVVPIYKTILPLANIISPNWYEVELLTDIKLENFASLRCALKILHEEYHVPDVVISSIPVKQWLIEALPPHLRPCESASLDNSSYLLCISSSGSVQVIRGTSLVHARCVPQLPGYFSGVGDLFSALLLGHFQPSNPSCLIDMDTPLSLATSFALTKTHTILRRTYEYAQSLPEDDRQPTDDEKDAAEPLRRTRRLRGRELRLVQSQDILRDTKIENCQCLEPWIDFWKLE